MVWFIASAVMLSRFVILCFIVSSICLMNMLCSAVNCASIASLISFSSRSFRVLNRVARSSLEEFYVSSAVIASKVGLAVSLVVDTPLV